MKALGIIVATLMFVSALVLAIMTANKALGTAEYIDSRLHAASPEQRADIERRLGDKLPSTLRLEVGAMLIVLTLLLALPLLVTAFVKRHLLIPIAVVTLAISALAAIVFPEIRTAAHEGMGPRAQQIIATVMFALGVGAAFLVKRATARKAAPALAAARTFV